MRNLKKLLAVVLTVVMLASMMVPALAANTYEEEALKLQSIGMFAGEPADLKLEEGVTRIQGLAFAIRAAGKEADAFAMTDEEVATILAGYVDGADVPAWGRKYAAYAIKNGITVGVSATEKKFAALDPISGTSFLVFLMKAGMGYADVTTANVVEAAVTAGILTAGQAAQFGAKAALIRDDAAGILFGAAMNGVNADGTPLIEALIASGFVDADAALAAGFVVEVEPEDLEVVSVEALNLIQVEVVFNKEVDSDTAEDENNYDVEGKSVDFAELQDDNKTVILTLNAPADQQDELDVEIEDVEDLDENALKDVTFEDVYFIDTTMPKVESVEIVGIDTLKVTFSEPVTPDSTLRACFEVKDANGNKIYVKADNVTTGTRYVSDAMTAVYVILSSDLDDEESITVKVNSDMEDFAGFSVMPNSNEIAVVVDEDAPEVVGYKDAKLGSVTLIFNEDIKVLGGAVVGDFYHTNSKSPVKAVPSVTKGNELKLEFDEDSQLPEGTAYVYIDEEVISDYWENENEQIMVKVEVEVDETKPVLEKIEVDEEDQITLTFSEDVTKVSRSDFTVYDEDDEEVSIKTVSVSGDEVVIVFRENLSGDYTITIEDIEDLAGNKISKTTETFNVDDKTAPVLGDSKVTVTVYKFGTTDQMIKVYYAEKMATTGKYSVLLADNYILNDGGTLKDLSDLEEVVIESVDDGKGVEIYIPYDPTDKDIKDNPSISFAADKLIIARVADAAGNYTVALSTEKDIDDGSSDEITITKAEIVDAKTIKVTLSDKIADFYEEDLVLVATNPVLDTDNIAKISLTVNDDGNTVLVITLDEEIISGGYTGFTIATNATTESENQYGTKLKPSHAPFTIADKVAPTLAKDGDDDAVYAYDNNGDGFVDYVVLKYEENIDTDLLSKYTYAIKDISIVDAYTVADLSDITSGAEAAGLYVVLELDTLDEDIPEDTAWLPDVEQKASIYDTSTAANELKAADADIVTALDKAAPRVESVTKTAANTIVVVFGETLDATTAKTLANYTLDIGDDDAVTPNEIAATAVLSADKYSVTLTFATDPTVGTDTLDISGVKDAAGNTMDALTGEAIANP